ncbi:ribonucleotide-diphosphate reductase subunit alpha [Paenibacillus jamilae]|uniref:Ribonucleotide-diphosphate reductase subunit alpha n=1 Tax=Paenibacillus jamilae TaxID=114136 RepID=A0ACC5A0W1_9BACL|nr:class 1b ribonucleoside-diphosphate reductase subunit alpha [Paenibacillus jamilae]KTS84488.1 ribonucleotide-diphosphate reductase subunit alpha [Paenibacillus jamilae]
MIRKDGFYQLDKDREAVAEYLKEVNEKSLHFSNAVERIRYMVSEGYYYPEVLEEYTEEQIEAIHRQANVAGLTFASYMAASKFYKDYALKTRDKKTYLETYPQRLAIVALHLGRGNFQTAQELLWGYINGFQPATPTFLNAGKARRGEFVSCFLLELDDSLNSIGHNYNTAMQLSKIGGGVALNLSKLRGRGETIKEEQDAAKGAMPVAKQLEYAFSYADQMGQRKGAGAVYYNIFGWDVEEILDSKKINADEAIRLKSLSVGLIVPDKFIELATKNEPYYVFAPHTVYTEYGVHLDDMDLDEMYEQLVVNPNVRKRQLDARDMLTKIAITQIESGYPYIMFKDNANRDHALRALGQIKMSNLCTEIFQLQQASVINDYGVDDEINLDISCNLGSVNIVTAMASGDLRRVVHAGMDSLTAVSDMTSIANAPSVRKANDLMHSVGLGAMNLQGYLVKNKISYQSSLGREFADAFFMAMNFYSLERSMMIARERGGTFHGFEKSDYYTGVYFRQYLENDFRPKSAKVAGLFEGMHVPGPEDWAQLMKDVRKYGVWHSYRMAVAPTQSISYVQNATSSVLPIVDLVETRTYANSTTYYPAPFLAPENQISYTTAFNMDQFRIIDMVATIQQHVDQGISTILFVDSNTPTNQLVRYYLYAHRKGLKSLYYTRNKLLSADECTSCAV